MKRTDRLPMAAMAAAIVVLCPMAYLVALSVTKTAPPPRVLPAGLRLDAWASILAGRAETLHALGVSLMLSVGVAALSTPLGFLTARSVAFHRRRRWLLLFAYLPFVLSPVILGTCMFYFYIRSGLTGSLAGVYLSQTFLTLGFSVVFFLPFWNREKLAFEDLVSTLGGSRLQFYRFVLWPISRDALRVGTFQIFLLSWFQYGLTLLIGEGKIRTLPVLVYAYVGEASPLFAAAAGVLLVLPPLVLLGINWRVLRASA